MKTQSCVIWIQTCIKRFTVYRKTDDIYKDIAEDVEIDLILKLWIRIQLHWQTANKRKSIKVIGLMEDELGGKIMTKFVGLRAKTSSYLIDNLNLKIIKTL